MSCNDDAPCSDEKEIIVRLELRIPVGVTASLATATPHGVSQQFFGAQKKPQRALLGYPIYNPKDPARVRVDNATGKKYICADGLAIDSSGAVATTVYAALNPTTFDPNNPPATPPAGTPSTPVNASSGYWCFKNANELEGATCGPTTYPTQNVLVLWYEFSPGNCTTKTIRFKGICDTKTDCAAPMPPQSGGVFAGTAPNAWRLCPRGFGGGVADFNGDWRLVRQPSPGSQLLWCGGGDGTSTPRLELTFDLLGAAVWRLSFRLGSACVEYTRPADLWAPLGVNTFTSLATCGLAPTDAVPAALTVEPCR